MTVYHKSILLQYNVRKLTVNSDMSKMEGNVFVLSNTKLEIEKIHNYMEIRELIDGFDMDLIADIEEILRIRLKNWGVKTKNQREPITDYFRFMRRLIKAKPREIYKSKDFACPDDYENKLEIIERKIIEGKDLTPFLSKKVMNLCEKDSLLYEWNIYHLHISDKLETESEKFMERAGYLLIALFTNEAAYFITTEQHQERPTKKESSDLWANDKYLQIVEENWPHLLDHCRVKNMTLALEDGTPIDNLRAEARYDVRKVGINVPVELNGNGYFPLGGGFALDGSSFDAVKHADKFHNSLIFLEFKIAAEYWDLLREARVTTELIDKNFMPNIKAIDATVDLRRIILKESKSKISFIADYNGNDNWNINILRD